MLAVRNTDKGEAAAREIGGETEVRRLDLADLASVRAFAQDFGDRHRRPDQQRRRDERPARDTADGFEMQIGTNHLGHFALTNLLLPRIRERVVVVASGAHRFGKIRLDDLNSERGYHRHRAYGQAKLANLLFMAELQRRLSAADSAGQGHRRASRLGGDQPADPQRQPARERR